MQIRYTVLAVIETVSLAVHRYILNKVYAFLWYIDSSIIWVLWTRQLQSIHCSLNPEGDWIKDEVWCAIAMLTQGVGEKVGEWSEEW